MLTVNRTTVKNEKQKTKTTENNAIEQLLVKENTPLG
jgi:hypothetical protein